MLAPPKPLVVDGAPMGEHDRVRVAVRVVVTGMVQGVGFRAACHRAARQAGIDGWVRNLPDGRVEAWLEGDRDGVGRVAAWCRHGPSWARVTGVDLHDEAPADVRGFDVR
jgi:acylphosphatase